MAAAVGPASLGWLLDPTAWPADRDRWAGSVRLLAGSAALWLLALPALALLYLPLLCGSRVKGPALLLGLVVYLGVALVLVRDPDAAVLTWPLAVLAGLVAVTLVAALGPQGYCVT